ncbi:nucleotidyl transferase AbiEii/AbiGii toxin family protein [Candidatus Gottesmanbacteria bacterium]|nr:nucleotidyl transferase AbiEii/AbiGii toxin family protein [Candidatus Gottesmanbacteria bacterium]
MLNIDIHRTVSVNILRAIYTDPALRTVLGFKGGTAAMLFYDLPRFSVDLDFDLLDAKKKAAVLDKLTTMLPAFGMLREASEKYYTLFFLLNYRKGERNLKIEISKRPIPSAYVSKSYLGIPMLVMKEEDVLASKLAALLTRKRLATRDIFDLWFFLKSHWELKENLVRKKTALSIAGSLTKALRRVQSVKRTELLSGLGELLDPKQKAWVKEKLVDDTIFYLRLYKKSLSLQHLPK